MVRAPQGFAHRVLRVTVMVLALPSVVHIPAHQGAARLSNLPEIAQLRGEGEVPTGSSSASRFREAVLTSAVRAGPPALRLEPLVSSLVSTQLHLQWVGGERGRVLCLCWVRLPHCRVSSAGAGIDLWGLFQHPQGPALVPGPSVLVE